MTDIGGRLEGILILAPARLFSYENGGESASYEKVTAIENSRKGDHVLICLVFIPSNCPQGDSRGKIYTTTNLRTLEIGGLFRILNTAAAALKRLFAIACDLVEMAESD